MSEPFLGEIRVLSFAFAPRNWALCNGQLLPINQNQALFSLLGTTYGGNGQTTFALPDLRGRVPLHVGPENSLGTQAGAEAVTLTAAELPTHFHSFQASADVASVADPSGATLAKKPRFGADVYAAGAATTPLAPQAIGASGGGQAHSNLQPYTVLNFCIALSGIFPSPS